MLISLRTPELISSFPQEEDLLRFDRILRTLSGWTDFSLKEQVLFCISFCTNLSGSPEFCGKFCLRFLTLLIKKLFIILAISDGLVKIVPFSISLEGGPPLVQPSQLFIFTGIFLSCKDFFLQFLK